MSRKKNRKGLFGRMLGKSGETSGKPAESPPKPEFEVEALEPRILLSATWIDTDTSVVIPDATGGDDTFTGDGADDIADGLAGDDILSGLGGNDTLIGVE